MPDSADIKGDRIIVSISTAMPAILKTIRTIESNGNYKAQAQGSSASGAYQFIDSSWQSLGAGVTGANTARAKDAAPEVQDAVATKYATQILTTHGMHLAAIPVCWYYPAAWGNAAILDSVPAPDAGNTLTVREYAERWLATIAGIATMDGGNVVTDTVGDAVETATNAVSTFTEWASALTALLNALLNPETYVRIVKVIGGILLIGGGIYLANSSVLE